MKDKEYSPKKNRKVQNPGKWSLQENKKYLEFLEKYKALVEDKASWRKQRIFLIMSKEVKERTPDQCRGHHRKMISRYSTSGEIIASLRQKIKKEAVKEIKIKEKVKEEEEEEDEVFKLKSQIGENLTEQRTLYIYLDINIDIDAIGVW